MTRTQRLLLGFGRNVVCAIPMAIWLSAYGENISGEGAVLLFAAMFWWAMADALGRDE